MKQNYAAFFQASSQRIIIFFLFILSANVNSRAQQTEWNNLAIHEVGTESTRASFMYYSDKETALSYVQESSPFYLSLNGTWNFQWSRRPSDRPVDFYKSGYPAKDWKKINVPGDWQMQGYDVPIDFNIGYAFERNVPYAPENYNPVGSYLREFETPKNWSGKQVFLHFAGVSSAFYV